jgi:hypothetical protein
MRISGSALVLAAFVTGCHLMRVDEAMEFTEIRIESRSESGTFYAHKTAYRNGEIRGGHLSGGPDAPHIFENSGRIEAEDLDRLRLLAGRFRNDFADSEVTAKESPKGAFLITISYGDGRSISVSGGDAGFESAVLRAIEEILHSYDIGGW